MWHSVKVSFISAGSVVFASTTGTGPRNAWNVVLIGIAHVRQSVDIISVNITEHLIPGIIIGVLEPE